MEPLFSLSICKSVVAREGKLLEHASHLLIMASKASSHSLPLGFELDAVFEFSRWHVKMVEVDCMFGLPVIEGQKTQNRLVYLNLHVISYIN